VGATRRHGLPPRPVPRVRPPRALAPARRHLRHQPRQRRFRSPRPADRRRSQRRDERPGDRPRHRQGSERRVVRFRRVGGARRRQRRQRRRAGGGRRGRGHEPVGRRRLGGGRAGAERRRVAGPRQGRRAGRIASTVHCGLSGDPVAVVCAGSTECRGGVAGGHARPTVAAAGRSTVDDGSGEWRVSRCRPARATTHGRASARLSAQRQQARVRRRPALARPAQRRGGGHSGPRPADVRRRQADRGRKRSAGEGEPAEQ
jgi:hypothetical protein